MKKRKISFYHFFGLVLLLSLLIPVSADAQKTEDGLTTFILVRHAEKADDSRNPELSETGQERAQKLAEMFEHISFDAAYSTDFIRTKETAKPVADANNLTIQNYDSSKSGGRS